MYPGIYCIKHIKEKIISGFRKLILPKFIQKAFIIWKK